MFKITILVLVSEPFRYGGNMNRPWKGKRASGLPDQFPRRGPAVGVVGMRLVSFTGPSCLFTFETGRFSFIAFY